MMTNSIKKNHEDQTIKQRQQQEEENNHQLPNITSIITTSTSFSDLEQEQEDQEEQQLNDDDDINVVKNFDDNQYVDVSNPSKQQHEQSLVIISWNLFCCFMAWAFTVSIATLVIGTSSVVILSLGNDTNGGNVALTSLPVGAFFIGIGLVSGFSISTTLFQSYGDQYGLVIGCIVFGLLGGVTTSLLSIYYTITSLYLISNICIGMSVGMNYYIRYMVTELVPIQYKVHAVTLTVSGGVIAAFIGPEISYYFTQNPLFITEQQTQQEPYMIYMSAYFMVGIFYIINIICIMSIRYPPTKSIHNISDPSDNNDDDNDVEEKSTKLSTNTKNSYHSCINDVSNVSRISPTHRIKILLKGTITMLSQRIQLWISLLQYKEFVLAMMISALSWTVMAVPMSVVRIAMSDLNIYTSLQSIRVIESHFVGMYATGFISGHIISYIGNIYTCLLGVIVSLISIAISLSINPTQQQQNDVEDGSSTITLWVLSMILCGMGWNFAFTSATIWITQLYHHDDDNNNNNITTIQQQCNDSKIGNKSSLNIKAVKQPDMEQDHYHHQIITAHSSYDDNNRSPNVTIDVDDDEMMEVWVRMDSSSNNNNHVEHAFSLTPENEDRIDNDKEGDCHRNDIQDICNNDIMNMFTKGQIQSTNEFFMFIISGLFIFFASYIYQAGGSGLNGWRMLNYVVFGIAFFYLLLVSQYIFYRH